MFEKLAMFAILAYENQPSDVKLWRTKEASDQFDVDAYLAGFRGSFIKEASEDTYVAASELGVCLGEAVLGSIKKAK